MSNPTFQTAAVIGTGMMGPGIAGSLALGGLSVALLSRSQDSAQSGVEKAAAQLNLLASHGLIPPDAAASAAARIAPATDLDATAAAVDLLIESAPENMAFKQELFARLDAAARPSTVITSNTSGLSITAIASRCRHPERVVTTHFWNPPHLMPLVEIVKGERTDPAVCTALRDLLARCGKTGVIVHKDTPGQLGNRLQMALVREAAHIVAEGIADAEAVDLVAKTGFGLRLPMYGILEHQDMVGLDMCLGIVNYVATDLYNQPQAPPMYQDMVAAGNLGVKTGSGFYDWSQRDPAAVRDRRDRFVLDFLKRWRAEQVS